MENERRKHPRVQTCVTARIRWRSNKEQLCTIQNFSPAGMLLTWRKETNLGLTFPKNGDAIDASFLIADSKGSRHFSIEGVVVRVIPCTANSTGGAGVVFPEPYPQPIAALLNYAQSHPLKGPSHHQDDLSRTRSGQSPEESVRRDIGLLLETFARGAVASFFERYHRDVDQRMDSAKDNQESICYFNAAVAVARSHDLLPEQYVAAVTKLLEHLPANATTPHRNSQSARQSSVLELVDPDELDISVTLAGMSGRTESRFQQDLYELSRRLTFVFGGNVEAPENPFEPSAVFSAFRQVTNFLNLATAPRQHLLESFETASRGALQQLYREMTLALPESGAVSRSVNPNPSSDPLSRQSAREREVTGQYNTTPSVWLKATHPSQAALARGNQPDPEITLQSLLTVFDASSDRLQIAGALSNRGESGTTVPLRRVEHFKAPEVLAAIPVLEKTLAVEAAAGTPPAPGELRPRIVKMLEQLHPPSEMVRRLSNEEGQKVSLMDALVMAVFDEAAAISVPLLGDLVSRLQASLLKIAFDSGSFSLESGHPIPDMLNAFERAIALASTELPSLRERQSIDTVRQLADEIAAEVDCNVEMFLSVTEQVQRLIEPQQRMFAQNVGRLIQAYEGRQRLARASAAAECEIARRMDHGVLPEPVQLLWDAGWAHVLQLTYLRDGLGSSEWKYYLSLLDAILERLRQGREAPDAIDGRNSTELLHDVVQALKDNGTDATRAQSVSETLRIAFDQRPSMALPSKASSFESEPHSAPTGLDVDRESVRWIRKVRNLTCSDWLRITLEGKHSAIGKIVWMDDARKLFVLVDRRGLKLEELSAEELARQLQFGNARQLGNLEEPLVARIAPKIMSRMQVQIADQANRDELTGLLTRSELERKLERLLGAANTSEAQGCFCHFHLDHLGLVTNACGYHAGDAMIAKAAEVLKSRAPSNALVGRLSSEDFGVFLTECDRESGLGFTETLRAAVHALRFECAERRFMTTTSVGLLHIASYGTSADSALTGAATACHAAQAAGKNRTQSFSSDSRQLASERNQFDLVSLIDKALDEQLFQFRCQPIVPLAALSESGSHYEILLLPPVAGGQAPSAFEVIKAAEAYDRIGRIDRWVAANALEWIVKHQEILPQVGGFSINLSGSSLNDSSFAAFLFELLERLDIPTGKLNFEVTESASIAKLSTAAEFIAEVRELGYGFFLDDFGTGFATFEYLRELPFDKLKIDGSFVRTMATNPGDLAIVRSMNEVAHFMGKETVAEFVDSEAILQLLREIGVDYAQGYHLSKPFLLDDLPAKLA